MASNEELAQRVKSGEPEATLLLWEAVRRFVCWNARRYISYNSKIDVDELIQSGFLSMLKAAETFDPERGSFTTYFSLHLKTAFAEAAAMGAKKRDALKVATSLDVPLSSEDESESLLLDFIEDESAALAFVDVEYKDFQYYSRRIIAAALDTLPAEHKTLLQERYLHGRSLKRCAALLGYSSKQAAHDAEERALYKLRHGKYSRQLRACLVSYDDFRLYGNAASGGSSYFYAYGISTTEAAAMVNIGG